MQYQNGANGVAHAFALNNLRVRRLFFDGFCCFKTFQCLTAAFLRHGRERQQAKSPGILALRARVRRR